MESVINVKNRLKKVLLIIISAIMAFSLVGCTGKESSDSDKLKIVTTLFPQYDFAKQITGDNAEITLLLTPGSESHSYEPTPKDVAKIQQADLFLYIGGQSEIWTEEVLESASNSNLKTVRLMDYVDTIEQKHEHEDEHSHENEMNVDEHIFTSLKNSQILLNEICNAICEKDSKNSELYKKNAEAYSEKLAELDSKFTELTDNAKTKTVIFGDRFPMIYFANDYGLDCHAAFSGCSSETEASSATMSSLIDKIKSESIPVIFYIEFSSQIIADKLSDATGAKTLLFHSCHNISKEDLENNVSFVDLMKQNYQNLSEALN